MSTATATAEIKSSVATLFQPTMHRHSTAADMMRYMRAIKAIRATVRDLHNSPVLDLAVSHYDTRLLHYANVVRMTEADLWRAYNHFIDTYGACAIPELD